MKWYRFVSVMAALVLAVTASATRADISLEMVTVGNVGNANDTTGYGGVNQVYAIGKYEVTAGQYTAFLNAVAATDTHGLYLTDMDVAVNPYGCGIKRSGSSGSYMYSVAADRANRPVSWVSWGDSARFINWLHNGQPIGAQGPDTTEDGAYYLNGATSRDALMAVASHKVGAKYWLPTENEWYKAAYHKNDGVTGNYWDYPTSSDSVPSNDLVNPDPGNNANFFQSDDTIGSPYWRTDVGEFENSDSPYGTFDQGGNVFEWNEEVVFGDSRGVRGSSWINDSDDMLASFRGVFGNPTHEFGSIGFRVASVPEPGSITLMLIGALAGLLWWNRKRKS